MPLPDNGENTLEGWPYHGKTLVRRYHEAHQDIQKQNQRVAQITQKHWYPNMDWQCQSMRKKHQGGGQITEKHKYTNTMRHARIREKHTIGVPYLHTEWPILELSAKA